MATKNKFSNYENLFSAYRESISATNLTNKTNFSQEIENKKQQLIDILKENYITPTIDVNNYFNSKNIFLIIYLIQFL